MAAKLTILTHKIAIQLHLVAENCTTCSSGARRPIRKLLVTPSYIKSCRIVAVRCHRSKFCCHMTNTCKKKKNSLILFESMELQCNGFVVIYVDMHRRNVIS
jgi:hypothetical protein